MRPQGAPQCPVAAILLIFDIAKGPKGLLPTIQTDSVPISTPIVYRMSQ